MLPLFLIIILLVPSWMTLNTLHSFLDLSLLMDKNKGLEDSLVTFKC